MAKADYILCDVCDCKVIYDGSWALRDSWKDDEWPTVICATCTRDMRPELSAAIETQKRKIMAKT